VHPTAPATGPDHDPLSILSATDERPEQATPAPAGPRPGTPASSAGRRSGGVNPFVVVGIALVAGVVLAKWLDRRARAG
jgi:hypothetical protein